MVLIQDHTLTQPTLAEVMACNAAAASYAVSEDLPVMRGRELVGIASPGRWRPATHQEKRWASWTKYDDYKSSMNSKKSYRAFARYNTAQKTSPWNDYWPQASVLPGTGAGDIAGTALTARQFDDTTAAAIWHGGNKASEKKYLVGLDVQTINSFATIPLPMILYDRVLAYDANTISTSSQNMTNTLTAQRYVGTGLPGLQIFIAKGGTATGATASNITTLTYVDQDGNTATCPTTQALAIATSLSDTGNLLCPFISGTGNMFSVFMPLAVGDSGVRSITNYQCSANNTGTMSMVLAKPLAWFFEGDNEAASGEYFNSLSFVDTYMAMERIYDGACLSFLYNADGNTNGLTRFQFGVTVAWT